MRFELTMPALPISARIDAMELAGLLARLVAGGARSKADLGRATGLSRTTVDAGVATLLGLGAVRSAGLRARPGRGRPAELLELSPGFGAVLVADCGATGATLGVFDLAQHLLAERRLDLRIEDGPDAVLPLVVDGLRALLEEVGAADRDRTLVVGLPGPVDSRRGTLVRPPIMPGWDGHPVSARLAAELGCEVRIENDVNLRAIGEARATPPQRGPVLYVKVGTGIGVGIVGADGALLRGADGAAGDVGHIRVRGEDAVCACGAVGCLEAVSSVRAIGLALGIDGADEAALHAQVVARVRRREPRTLALVRERAVHVGEVVVSTIHFFNPERIIVGGALAAESDDLLATVRSVVYQRALPLATRNLVVTRPELGERSGLAGGLALGTEAALEPDALARRIRSGRGLLPAERRTAAL